MKIGTNHQRLALPARHCHRRAADASRNRIVTMWKGRNSNFELWMLNFEWWIVNSSYFFLNTAQRSISHPKMKNKPPIGVRMPRPPRPTCPFMFSKVMA